MDTDEITQQELDETYMKLIVAGNAVPEQEITKTLPKKKKPFHGAPTLRFIEQRMTVHWLSSKK